MFAAVFGMVNDFPCQHEFSFAKQIQTSILDETIFGREVAVFGNILTPILEFQSSNGVLQSGRMLQSEIMVLFDIFIEISPNKYVFETNDVCADKKKPIL